MGIAGFPDIFQSRMSELMVAFERIRAYMDDLLCITKASQNDYLHKLNLVLTRLWDMDILVNIHKLSFCAIEMEYLGYVLTRDGIKPHPKKVQAILMLPLPQNVKQLCRFQGMVQ